jgi:hypothetical protein
MVQLYHSSESQRFGIAAQFDAGTELNGSYVLQQTEEFAL